MKKGRQQVDAENYCAIAFLENIDVSAPTQYQIARVEQFMRTILPTRSHEMLETKPTDRKDWVGKVIRSYMRVKSRVAVGVSTASELNDG